MRTRSRFALVSTLLLLGLCPSQTCLAKRKRRHESVAVLLPGSLHLLPGTSLLTGFPELQREIVPFMFLGLQPSSLSHPIDMGAFVVSLLTTFIPGAILGKPVLVFPVLSTVGIGVGVWGRLQ